MPRPTHARAPGAWLRAVLGALLTVTSNPALSDGLPATASPPHQTLHLPLTADLAPHVGPRPEVVGAAPAVPVEVAGQRGLRLGDEKLDGHGRVVHPPPAPCLRFAARPLIANAQGAVSFWIRAPRVKDARAHDFPLLLQLTNSTGGAWTFAVREVPYTPDVKSFSSSEAQAEAQAQFETRGLAESDRRSNAAAAVDLDRAETPMATVQCRIAMTLWPEGAATMTVGGSRPSLKAQQWHHLVWAWQSLHHDVYIDGQRVGGDEPQNRLSRMAPMTGEGACLEVLTCSADLRDLRLHDRWLAPEDAARLSTLTQDEALPALPPVRVWADWAYSTGRSVVYVDAGGVAEAATATVRCLNEQGQSVGEVRLASLPDRLGEVVARPFDPAPFPPGTYRFEAVLQDAAGQEVGRAASADWHCEKQPWPFLGFAGGRPEAAKTPVIPPFTPVAVDGPRVATALRQHHVGRTGLFDSIIAAGEELLAAPIHLNVVANGQPLAFGQGPGLGTIRPTAVQADWQAETRTVDGQALQVAAHLEYDGVTRFDVTLAPTAALAVERVELIVPFRPETARLCHSGLSYWFGAIERGGDGAWSCRRTNWAGPGAARARRPGVLFDSFDKTAGLFPPPLRESFTPYMHIGNDDRGLSWFVDNDQGWLHAPAIPPLEFVAQGDATFLRLNLVAQPAMLDRPVTWRFYLLANPFKPLPPKWRAWGVGQNRRGNDLLKQASHLFWWHWSEYAGSFRPYPGPAVTYDGKPVPPDDGQHALTGTGTYEQWRDKFKHDEVRHLPFINFGTPGGFPGFTPECMVYPYTWKLHNSQPHQDYVAYWLDRCVRDIGIDGVYIDEPYCEPYSYNVLAGDAAYIRPDGTRALGYRFMEGRAYIRRLKQLFTDHGIDYSIWLHNTNYRALPVMTFIDIGMDGEHPAIWVPEFDDYHGFYNPTQSQGYLAGRPFGFVGAQMFHGNTNPRGDDAFARVYRKCRTYLAVTLPNGVLPMSTSFAAELDRIQNIHAAFGLADQEPEELTAAGWAAQAPELALTPAPAGLTALRLPQAGRTLLHVAALAAATNAPVVSSEARPVLNTGKPHPHLWDAENGASLRVNGQWRLATPPGDFACVWIEGRDTPQPDRPDGLLLSVSFDQGLEAEAGGGLLPVATTDGASLPALVAGRSGGGLAVSAAIPAPAYAVVPAWAQGSVQFDLQAERAPAQPLTLLRLEHHLDCELQLATRGDAMGLLFTTRETPLTLPVPVTAYQSGNPPATARSVFGKLPAAAPDGWRRVVLTWQAGRYRLYCDGAEIAALLEPAAPRLRDALAPVRGVRFGDGAGGGAGRAVLDSIRVYDWTLSSGDVQASRTAAAAVAPVTGDRPDAFAIWHDPEARKWLRVGAAFAGHEASARVTHVRFTLWNTQAGGDKPLAVHETVPWCGTAWSSLAMQRADQLTAVPADFGDAAPTAAAYRLQVELLERRRKGTDAELILARREQTLELDPLRGLADDL